jgi:fumarate hydratase subunit alpha
VKFLELKNVIENVVITLLKLAATRLPKDVEEALINKKKMEKTAMGKVLLESILKNIELAKNSNKPICQDTGTIYYYLRVGDNFKELGKLKEILISALVRATEEIPLRPNAVDLLKGNTGNNVGSEFPHILWEIVPGDQLELTVFLKGGGSENLSYLRMCNPNEGLDGIKRTAIDAVAEAGKACPPLFVGVAVAGGADIAMDLAKRALLRPVGSRHPQRELAQLEEELLDSLNELGVGVMGMGCGPTVLDVHLEYGCRHPASFPVAINICCWASRRSSAKIYSDGTVEYLTPYL